MHEKTQDLTFTIYLITNNKTGKSYVGFTHKNYLLRWEEHKSKSQSSDKYLLHNTIKKYGEEVFHICLIGYCSSLEEAVSLEKKYIQELKTVMPYGYNMTYGGEGCVASEELKIKMKKSASKRCENLEIMNKQREMSKRVWNTIEGKQKISLMMKKSWENKGQRKLRIELAANRIILHPELREKSRLNAISQWENPEIREKMIIGLKRSWEVKKQWGASQGKAEQSAKN